MVYLNKVVSVNIKSLEKLILEKVHEAVQNELYYVDIKNEMKEKINKNILKEIKNKIKTDNFIYRIMDDEKCVFKHNRGKYDGYFCCNKITKNGNKKEYKCRKHNKSHVPKPRNNNIKDNIPFQNKDSISQSINLTKKNIYNYEELQQKDNKPINIINSYDIYKKNKFKNNINKKEKKILIENFNLNSFKKIVKEYNNFIVCKYKVNNNCDNINKHGHCDFKHINNNIFINDFLVDNNVKSF